MASIFEVVSMIADFGQQQWSYTNFRLSDRTLRIRDRILEYSQDWWKYARPPIIWTSAYILACQAGTTSRYSTGGTPPIKAEQAGLCSHLGSTWQRGNISTMIWTRALQPVQKEVSSLRFRRAQTVRGPPTFSRSADISPSAEILTPAKIPLSAYISVRRQHFYKSANILCIRQYFHETPIFWNPPIFSWDANILEIRLYSVSANNLWICLIFVAANICVYFQYLFMHLSMRQYFWRNCFNLRFKIHVVVMIIWSNYY